MWLIAGIYGYIQVAKVEEQSLIAEFKEEYIQYMEKVGRFYPRIRIRKKN
ncbi:MAG: hypothetical protein ACTSQE_07255 [Candidatus Heimdallarchaeaceae archaeon]